MLASRIKQSGDTIIEVMLAFSIFAMIAVGTTAIMNSSISSGQRSLEMTLVRQQIDAQAELLRYARDHSLPAWTDIKSRASGVAAGIDDLASCPATHDGTNFFFLSMDPALGEVSVIEARSGNYDAAATHSQVDFANGRSHGVWVVPVHVAESGGSSSAYDMYVRTCWDSVGTSRPIQLATIVRLYDT